MVTLHDLEAGVKGAKDSHATISNKLFSHSKLIGPMIREVLGLFDISPKIDIKDMIWRPFRFQNNTKITLRQAFLAIYILWKSDTACCNILNFRTYQWFSNNQL